MDVILPNAFVQTVAQLSVIFLCDVLKGIVILSVLLQSSDYFCHVSIVLVDVILLNVILLNVILLIVIPMNVILLNIIFLVMFSYAL